MKLADIISLLDDLAPPDLALDSDYGRIGLVVPGKEDVGKVAVALDPTEAAINSAVETGADMLVVHHTLIYHPTSILTQDLADRLAPLLASDISLFCLHTNWDAAPVGVNDTLAKTLELRNVSGEGLHRIGEITPLSTPDFAEHVAGCLDTHVRWLGLGDVERVMVVSGSGFDEEMMSVAREEGVDALVSGDLRHAAVRARGDLVLVDATHYATEAPGMRQLASIIGGRVDSVFMEDDPGWGILG